MPPLVSTAKSEDTRIAQVCILQCVRITKYFFSHFENIFFMFSIIFQSQGLETLSCLSQARLSAPPVALERRLT